MRYVFHTVVMYTFRGTVYKEALIVCCMWDFWVAETVQNFIQTSAYSTILCIVQRRNWDGQHYVYRHTVHSTPRAVIQTLPYILKEGRWKCISGQGRTPVRRKFSQYRVRYRKNSGAYSIQYSMLCVVHTTQMLKL